MKMEKYTNTILKVSDDEVSEFYDSRYTHSIVFVTGEGYGGYIGVRVQREHRKNESIEQWSEIVIDGDQIKSIHAFFSENVAAYPESHPCA